MNVSSSIKNSMKCCLNSMVNVISLITTGIVLNVQPLAERESLTPMETNITLCLQMVETSYLTIVTLNVQRDTELLAMIALNVQRDTIMMRPRINVTHV